jgi:hypothetical protein
MPVNHESPCQKITIETDEREALHLVLSAVIDSLRLSTTREGFNCYVSNPDKRTSLGMAIFEQEYHALSNVLAKLTGGKA